MMRLPCRTIFDMSLPGVHDALTYDLTTQEGQAFLNDLKLFTDNPAAGATLSVLLRAFPVTILRNLAVAQTLTVSQQLDAGIRFFDLRATVERGLGKKPYTWYGYHSFLTRNPLAVYLQEIARWLDQHPTEVVVLFVSHFGNTNNLNQYPYADDAAMAQLGAELQAAFGRKLVDAAAGEHPATTSYADLRKKGRQVVLYLSDWKRFKLPQSFNASNAGCAGGIDNETGANVLKAANGRAWELFYYERWNTQAATNRADRRFTLMSGATSTPDALVADQFELSMLENPSGFLGYKPLHHCRAQFQFPATVTSQLRCPEALGDFGLMSNYYHAAVLDYIVGRPRTYRTPNAIYLDRVLPEGTIDIGTPDVRAMDGRPAVAGRPVPYSYLGTLLRSALDQGGPCPARGGAGRGGVTCERLPALVQQLRDAAPYVPQDDPVHGRLADWPPLPDRLPQCLRGYTYDTQSNRCWLHPYRSLQGSMCGGTALSCRAPDDGMCPEGWVGHCHGKCGGTVRLFGYTVSGCYEDCNVQFAGTTDAIRKGAFSHEEFTGFAAAACREAAGKGEVYGANTPLYGSDRISDHTLVDPARYSVCRTDGTWLPLTDAMSNAANGGDYSFNNGNGTGDATDYCRMP